MTAPTVEQDRCRTCQQPIPRGRRIVGRWCCRVWSYIDARGGELACWPWTGATNRHGYGFLSRPGKRSSNSLGHRAAYELAVGPIPDGAVLMHACDTPACCNPHHLRPGTQRENIRDSHAKGRSVGPPPRRGEQAHNAVLTDESVRHIRQLKREGLSQHQIAARIGVKRGTVCSVLRRKTWGHVDD